MLARLGLRTKNSKPDIAAASDHFDQNGKSEVAVHPSEVKSLESIHDADSEDSDSRNKPDRSLKNPNTAEDESEEDNGESAETFTAVNVKEKRIFAPAAFIISGGPTRNSRKCAICGRQLRVDRAAWTRRIGGGLWTKDHPNLAKTLSEESNPVSEALEKEFDRCVTCAHARERADVSAMAAHRLLPVLTGIDKIEYPDGSVYIG